MSINIYVICYFLTQYGWKFFIVNEGSEESITTIQCVETGMHFPHALLLPVDIGDGSGIEDDETSILLLTRDQYDSLDVSHFRKMPLLILEAKADARFYNDIYEIFRICNRWEGQLQDISSKSRDYQELIDCCDSMLDTAIALTDSDFRYVAYSRDMSEKLGYVSSMVKNGRLSPDVAAQLMSTPGFEALETRQDVFDFEDDFFFMAKNIFYQGKYVGRVLLMHEDDVFRNAYHRFILDKIGDYITCMYEKEGTFYLREERNKRIQTLMLSALKGVQVDEMAWSQAFREIGWAFSDEYYLIQIDVAYRFEKRLFADYLGPQIENRYPGTIAVKWEEKAVVLLNHTVGRQSFMEDLPYFVRDHLLIAGISRQITDLSLLRDAYYQARAASVIGVQKDPHLWHYRYDKYAFEYLKAKCREEISIVGLQHPGLVKLLAYDEKNHTDLYQSLYLFLDSCYNTTEAARRAFVHRTTFIKRMEQVEKVTGLNLEDWDTRVYLMLSYTLMKEKL